MTPRRPLLLRAVPVLLLSSLIGPAHAGAVKQTATFFSIIDGAAAGTMSDYARLTFFKLGMNDVIAADSYATVMTTDGKLVTVPLSGVSPSQGGASPKDGFVQFSLAGFKFNSGDEVNFKIVTNGNTTTGPIKATSGQFRTVSTGGVNTTDASFKVAGAQALFDPDLTLFNTLDPTVYSDTSLALRNLQFYTDLPQTAFDALTAPSALMALADLPADPSLPAVSIPDGGLADLGDVIGQPAPDDWDAVTGQIYDPGTGRTLTEFAAGSQAADVPEPRPLALLSLGLLAVGLLVRKRRGDVIRSSIR